MLNTKLLKKMSLFTMFFFIWFSITVDFNFAQEEIKLDRARKLYNEGDNRAAIKLLIEYIEEVKYSPGQRKNAAEAYYLLAKAYHREYEDNEVYNTLRTLFEKYPDFCKEEKDLNFKEKVEKIRKELNIICKEGRKGKKSKWFLIAAGVALVAAIIIFWPKPKKKTLTVSIGEGVNGSPASGSYEYKKGATVNYNYSLQDGYTDLTVTLDGNAVASSGTITMDRDHQLNAVSTQLGSINVTSTPTGANIFLDGVDTGQLTNAVIPNVIPGTHTIRLTLAGYDPAEQTVNVTAGQETPVNISLNRSYTKVITIPGKLGTKASGQNENTGQDAYQFYVGENCNLTIQVNTERHIRPEFALFDNANTTGKPKVKGDSGNRSITYTVTSSGKYYVVAIEDETPDKDEKAGTYTISITSNKKSLGDYNRIIDEGAETLEIFLPGRN